MLKVLFSLSAISLLSVLGACNTIQGVGKDVEAAGDAVENSAKKNKSY